MAKKNRLEPDNWRKLSIEKKDEEDGETVECRLRMNRKEQ
jgi:hypothetical protein